jgi:cell division control protein 6
LKYQVENFNQRILVLDEIDQIETTVKNPTELYKIFEWPYLPSSKLILIGIANALDFTDRLLPRLQLKPNTQPKLINFVPYSRGEIIEIVKDRLKDVQSADGKPLIDERALLWCASKIASSSGDIRKMLDICRYAKS